MASLQSAMTPAMPEEGAELVRPRAVGVAAVLVMIAGVVLAISGVLLVSAIGGQINDATTQYGLAVKQCDTVFGGIGSSQVPTTVATPTAGPTSPLPLTALPDNCRSFTDRVVSESQISSYRTSVTVIGVLWIVMGIAAAASGWFLREGRKWTRRVLIAVVLLMLVMAFLAQASTLFTLVATLLIVAGLSTTFIGRSSMFFVASALRKNQH